MLDRVPIGGGCKVVLTHPVRVFWFKDKYSLVFEYAKFLIDSCDDYIDICMLEVCE